MAADASAAQRAYDEIKQRILAGALPVRSRIDVEALARSLGLSSMPVRQALSMLSWERLVRPGQHSAYEVALKRAARTRPYAEAVHAVMRLIETGANHELRRVALNADQRLFAAREVEEEVLGDVQGEFETLVSAIAERSRRASTLQRAYTRRRVQNAGALRARVVLKALPNNGEPG